MEMQAFLAYSHQGRRWESTLALGQEEEADLFRLEFREEAGGKYLLRLDFKGEEIRILDFYVKMPCPYPEGYRIFVNGWQSWSESREYGPGEERKRLNPLAHFLLAPYGDYRFAPYGKVLTSWSYSYLRQGEDYLLIGSLGEEDGFVQVQHFPGKYSVRVAKDAAGLTRSRGSLSLRFGLYRGTEGEVFDSYFQDLGFPFKESPRVLGWTSWYNYYTAITEEIILENLKAFAEQEIPIEIFQIDDGYQHQVGDWTRVKESFPRGMGYVAGKIKEAGYRAGLWLAPFVCTGKSEIYREHSGWIARDRRGKPLKAGFNPLWGGFFYALDFYHPGFRDHLREVFSTVFQEWNYDMVKLDFLYAAALLKREDKTRGEMMHEAMAFLREAAGDKLILGCGVPPGAAYGRVDFCRIGCDVGLTWEDRLLKALNYGERVSTVNSLASTLGRRHLNGRVFKNDPDVFILREQNQKMSLEERKALLYLNMLLGGLVFTSDFIGEYGEGEMALYREALALQDTRVVKVLAEKLVFVETRDMGKAELFVFNLEDQEERVDLIEDWAAGFPGPPKTLKGRSMTRVPGKSGFARP